MKLQTKAKVEQTECGYSFAYLTDFYATAGRGVLTNNLLLAIIHYTDTNNIISTTTNNN